MLYSVRTYVQYGWFLLIIFDVNINAGEGSMIVVDECVS